MTRPILEQQHALRIEGRSVVRVLDGDAARLTQVLANLLNNAAKLTESEGQVRVVVCRADGLVEGTVLVLLDIGLPDVSGCDACRRIRDQPWAAATIVAMTGWGQDEDRRRTAAAGFDEDTTDHR